MWGCYPKSSIQPGASALLGLVRGVGAVAIVMVMLGVFVIPRDQGSAGLQRGQMVRLLPAVDSDREDPARSGQPFPRSIPCRHLLPDGGEPVVLLEDESGQHFKPERVGTIGRDTGHEPPGPWYGPW